LSYIEQRLLETEIVVLELLSAIYNTQTHINPQRLSEADRIILAEISQKQPKSAKIEEWKSLPLNTDEHRHEWWLQRCRSISQPIPPGSKDASQEAMTPQETWLDVSPQPAQYGDIQPSTTMQPTESAPSMLQQPIFIPPWRQSLDGDMRDTAGAFEEPSNNALLTSAMMGTSQSGRGAALTTPAQPEGSARTTSLSAERLRKYF